MQIKAKLKYLRIAPRKTRMVADLIRNKKAGEAKLILNFTVKRAAQPILKVLDSAIANARNNFHLDAENLYISGITVDEGPKYKRWMPRARGSASEIQKKTSHVTLVLKEIEPGKKIVGKEAEEIKAEKGQSKAVADKKSKIRPSFEKEKTSKPRTAKGIKRIFQRKAI